MDKNTPKDLNHCFKALDEMQAQDQTSWLQMNEDDALSLSHHDIGQWIRNNWGLWEEKGELYLHFVSLGIKHPDDMSGIILTSYHRHKNNKDLNLKEQVKRYIKYWEEK